MRQILKALALAALLLPGIAAAQTPQYPQTLPANTVWGRLGISSGPPQAIPFATLSARLTGATITLNSGNGQTAPGSMAGGNTYTFGANSDTPRFAGIGLGGAAPATGLEVYNAAVAPTGNGQGMFGAASVNGGMLLGQGSVYDASIANKSSAVALGVPTGTTGVVLAGTLTAASLSTVGTVAGSICATSAGLILYEAGVNCFTVSGISVASGKTLTVSNTLTFTGTDATSFAFPATSDTVGTLGATQTVTGIKTFSGTLNITGTGQINGTAFGTFATQNFATPPAIGGTTPAAGSFSTLTATTPVGLTSGGTNATTAAGARASGGLNIEALTSHGDSNYSILATDRVVGTSATLTASRTWTLPAASGVNAGQTLYVQDFKGFVSNVNTLTIARNGSDTINGGTGSQTINNANGGFLFVSDGVSNWSAQALGAQATAGVASLNGQTGNPSIVAGTGISVATSGGNISVGNTGATSVNGATGAVAFPLKPGGRLSLTASTPITTTDVTAATVMNYPPFTSPYAPIYDGTNVRQYQFTASTTDTVGLQVTLGASWTLNTNYDWFVGLNSSTVTLCSGPSWNSGAVAGSDTARGTGAGSTELQLYNGLWTNKNSMTCRYGNATTFTCAANQCTYLGTNRTVAAGQAEDSMAKRFLYNAYNQTQRNLKNVTESTSTWNYTSVTPRQANANTANQLDCVVGLAGSLLDIRVTGTADTTGALGLVGVGINSTSVDSSQERHISGGTNRVPISATLRTYPAIGRQFFPWLEFSSSATPTTSFYGQNVGLQSGISGTMLQ